MKQKSSPARAWIRLSYWLPLITGTLLAVYSFIPHLFFKFGDALYNTLSPFTLMGNTWRECQALFDASSATPGALRFAILMTAAVILSWICILWYGAVALASAVCSTQAFSCRPTDPDANRAKRWLQFFCPNRIVLAVVHLLPLLPAAFALLVERCYHTQMLYGVQLYYIGPPDLLLAAIFAAVNLCACFATLRWQREERMDMFCLYKRNGQ